MEHKTLEQLTQELRALAKSDPAEAVIVVQEIQHRALATPRDAPFAAWANISSISLEFRSDDFPPTELDNALSALGRACITAMIIVSGRE